jgi:hypothetical protein
MSTCTTSPASPPSSATCSLDAQARGARSNTRSALAPRNRPRASSSSSRRVQPLERRRRDDHRVVGAEQHLAATVSPQITHEFGWVTPDRVGRGVDVHVGVLARERDHLLGPRVANVPGDDHQLGEVEGDVVEVGDRAAGLRAAQRPGVAHLRAEWHPERHALGVQGIEVAVVGWQPPQPGHDAQATEAQLAHAAAQLAHGVHRAVQVDRGETGEAGGKARHERRDLVVGDQRPPWPVPRADQADVDPAAVHGGDRGLQRGLLDRDLLPRPASKRREHLVAQKAPGRVLHPGVDDHHPSLTASQGGRGAPLARRGGRVRLAKDPASRRPRAPPGDVAREPGRPRAARGLGPPAAGWP